MDRGCRLSIRMYINLLSEALSSYICSLIRDSFVSSSLNPYWQTVSQHLNRVGESVVSKPKLHNK